MDCLVGGNGMCGEMGDGMRCGMEFGMCSGIRDGVHCVEMD